MGNELAVEKRMGVSPCSHMWRCSLNPSQNLKLVDCSDGPQGKPAKVGTKAVTVRKDQLAMKEQMLMLHLHS